MMKNVLKLRQCSPLDNVIKLRKRSEYRLLLVKCFRRNEIQIVITTKDMAHMVILARYSLHLSDADISEKIKEYLLSIEDITVFLTQPKDIDQITK